MFFFCESFWFVKWLTGCTESKTPDSEADAADGCQVGAPW